MQRSASECAGASPPRAGHLGRRVHVGRLGALLRRGALRLPTAAGALRGLHGGSEAAAEPLDALGLEGLRAEAFSR